MHVGVMDRGDNPSGEVAKCTYINLSIPVTPLYDINKGLWRYCLLQSAVHAYSVVFFILQQSDGNEMTSSHQGVFINNC